MDKEFIEKNNDSYNDKGIGDWGLGIAQSPIPNPQSPFIFIITKLTINN